MAKSPRVLQAEQHLDDSRSRSTDDGWAHLAALQSIAAALIGILEQMEGVTNRTTVVSSVTFTPTDEEGT